MPTLEILSINIWTILISLANLLIIFLILKKLLWKPVQKVMEERKAMVDKQFADAADAQAEAEADKAQWAEKLATADEEAAARIAEADETARRHGDRVIADAKEKAVGIIRQAEAEAELERRKAEEGIKQEIVDVSALLATQMLGREVRAAQDAAHSLSSKLAAVERDNRALRRRLEGERSSEDWEMLAWQRLGLVRPGEIVFLFPQEEKQA